jgi:hypothetical protein
MKQLDSYLNDHLAGSVSALELIAHWAELYKGKPLGSFFTDIGAEVRADQTTLRDLMRSLDIGESSVRKVGAWVAEKIGRAGLKVAGNNPDELGLLVALEGLALGIAGKKLLWRALAAANFAQLKQLDFEELQRRAEQQMERVEAERVQVARRAFQSESH